MADSFHDLAAPVRDQGELWYCELGELEGEVVRLRAALEAVLACGARSGSSSTAVWFANLKKCELIARAALGESA